MVVTILPVDKLETNDVKNVVCNCAPDVVSWDASDAPYYDVGCQYSAGGPVAAVILFNRCDNFF